MYNITQLNRFMDTNAALQNFNSRQEYFKALTAFVDESGGYLTSHVPINVVSGDTARGEFLNELGTVSDLLESLGVTFLASELETVRTTSYGKDANALAQELYGFLSKVYELARSVSSARIDLNDEQASNKPVILAVDDKPELLNTVVGMLRDRYTVMAATSVNAALPILEKHKPDLFLLDIEMPRMNGYDFARILRESGKFEITPIIFLTSKNTRNDVVTAVKHGGTDYILKPVNQELLIGKIERYL